MFRSSICSVRNSSFWNPVCKCTGSKDLAIGHSGIVYYWIAAVVARITGNKERDAEEIQMNKNLNILRNLTISLSLAMTIVYIVVCIITMIAAPDLATETLAGTNFIIFSITYGVQFAVSIYVIQAGVRMVVAELVPAFKGLADKFISNAVPALDIPIIYPYQPNSVLIGFLSATVGAIIAFFPALLIKFGNVLVEETTFGGADASVTGMFITQLGGVTGGTVFTVICVILFLLPMVYSAMTKQKPGMTERD